MLCYVILRETGNQILLTHILSTGWDNPGHYCMDVKMSKGNVIPSLNGSQLYSSHPKQKCTKIYPEETALGPRPLPYMGKKGF